MDAVKATAQQYLDRFAKPRRYASARLRAKKQLAYCFDAMTWEQKRALVEQVFDGKTIDGRRMGVYLERLDGQTKYRARGWKYSIEGQLIQEQGQVPVSMKEFGLGFDPARDLAESDFVSRSGRSSTPR
jgi:hypothetical protein